MVLMDIGRNRKQKTEPPISQLWAELLCSLKECGVMGVHFKHTLALAMPAELRHLLK